jgi:hypothetical protein
MSYESKGLLVVDPLFLTIPLSNKPLKDRLGDQRGGGSEWEPIKILLEGD